MSKYEKYSDYLKFQSTKTLNPIKRQKWLNEEWQSKIDGFKNQVFSMLGDDFFKTPKKVLCIGARTGQEVVALREMGVQDVIGIDIIPHEPYVLEGDMHNLEFSDNSFDFIYTNVIDHSLYPSKMISEVERVLKVNGNFFLQCQIGIDQDEFTEFTIEHPIYDILPLTNTLFCNALGRHDRNFAGMNFSYFFTKNAELTKLFKENGNISSIEVPDDYSKIWSEINEPIQVQKLNNAMIYDHATRSKILAQLSKRAYYLTRIAKVFDCKKIAEVGTAEGYQFYSFCNYIKEIHEGNVSTCDPRDVRNESYKNMFDETYFTFYSGTSKEMSEGEGMKDFFYIDGLHDENSVLTDIFYLQNNQTKDRLPVWVFDDFDTRFGCFNDILKVCNASRQFKVYKVGNTASGQPSHQAIVVSHLGLK